jgi:hypothetical protein
MRVTCLEVHDPREAISRQGEGEVFMRHQQEADYGMA